MFFCYLPPFPMLLLLCPLLPLPAIRYLLPFYPQPPVCVFNLSTPHSFHSVLYPTVVPLATVTTRPRHLLVTWFILRFGQYFVRDHV